MKNGRGLLAVNSFLRGEKYSQLYEYLKDAASSEGIDLTIRTSGEVVVPFGKKQRKTFDFVIMWDKDLPLTRAYENAGIPVFNSSRAIELCDDKALTAEALARAGVRTPLTVAAPKTFSNIGYTEASFLSRIERYISYPMIVKQRFGSFGAQVYLARSREEAVSILRQCGGNEVIFQQFISESAGRDVRVNIVDGEVCGCMLRHNDHDFRSNVTNGGQTSPFDPPREYKELALAAANAVGADFAGVDVLFGEDGPIVCEVNASPHFKTTLQCTGVNLAQKIVSMIKRSVYT